MRRILGAHRLVVAYGLFEFRHMDDVTGTCFLFFVLYNMAGSFENVCEIISD